ncbi:response regulator transcription factor [Amycolatopsis sp. NPDC051128]|uniref:response regulator transcription factor n=1 Tax=Amycolatopsis sp. NPDC051128 TaxID=3155412 RepID=UPI0034244903
MVLADDQPMVRTGLRTLCERDGDIVVVAEVENGAAAVAAVRAHRPDVVLMDIRMPVLDGLTATTRIVADPGIGRDVRVLVLTTYEQDEYVFAALRAGASGFITKDIRPEALRDAVRTVAGGQSLLSPHATRTLIEAFVTNPPHQPDDRRLAVLTEREREVLALVGRGLSNVDIGGLLFLSPATVKTHVNRSMVKLDARDRAQLVVVAYETGLVRAGA